MEDLVNSEEFISWFSNIQEIVSEHDLTNSDIDPHDFVDHYLDGYEEIESIEEYFGFRQS